MDNNTAMADILGAKTTLGGLLKSFWELKLEQSWLALRGTVATCAHCFSPPKQVVESAEAELCSCIVLRFWTRDKELTPPRLLWLPFRRLLASCARMPQDPVLACQQKGTCSTRHRPIFKVLGIWERISRTCL